MLNIHWTFMILLQFVRPGFRPWVGKVPWRREWLLEPSQSTGNPLQYSGLENSMDYTVANSQTWLSDFHFMIYKHWDDDCVCPISFQASPQSCNWRGKWQPHSSILAWRIPGTGEPGGLLSMGLHRVGHDWSDLAAAAAAAAQSCKIGNILRFIFQIRKLRLGEYPTESGRVLLGGAEI